MAVSCSVRHQSIPVACCPDADSEMPGGGGKASCGAGPWGRGGGLGTGNAAAELADVEGPSRASTLVL